MIHFAESLSLELVTALAQSNPDPEFQQRPDAFAVLHQNVYCRIVNPWKFRVGPHEFSRIQRGDLRRPSYNSDNVVRFRSEKQQ